MNRRNEWDRRFEGAGRLLYRHPWSAIALVLGLTAVLAMGLGSVHVVTSAESFLKRDDPTRIRSVPVRLLQR